MFFSNQIKVREIVTQKVTWAIQSSNCEQMTKLFYDPNDKDCFRSSEHPSLYLLSQRKQQQDHQDTAPHVEHRCTCWVISSCWSENSSQDLWFVPTSSPFARLNSVVVHQRRPSATVCFLPQQFFPEENRTSSRRPHGVQIIVIQQVFGCFAVVVDGTSCQD